jgi:glycerol-3-phosphate acyltransferase PlsY
MLRIGGKKVAIITLIFDILKGVIPVVIAKYLGFNLEEITLIGLFALIGHIFPVFFNFRGGKGVATFIGVLLTLNFYSGLIFVGIWLFVAKVLRISSISALIAAFFAPVYFYSFTQNVEATVIIICICLLIFITHRSNIRRLINQEEDNINAK